MADARAREEAIKKASSQVRAGGVLVRRTGGGEAVRSSGPQHVVTAKHSDSTATRSSEPPR